MSQMHIRSSIFAMHEDWGWGWGSFTFIKRKLDSRLPTTRGGIPFLSIRTQLQPWYNFIFSIASQHDLDIGHQGHLGTNKCNDTVKHSKYEVLECVCTVCTPCQQQSHSKLKAIPCSRNNFTCTRNNITCSRNNSTCARNNYYVLT